MKLNSTFLMPAKKPFKKVVAFKQVSKLSKFRKKNFFENSEISMYLIGIKESLFSR